MSTKKTNQAKTPELSPAVMAHQTTVRRLFQEAVESGRMTEQQLQNCLEHADGTPWDEIDHSKQAKWNAINVDVVWQTYDYNAFRLVPGLNRDVDHWKRLVESMAQADLMSPIIVNEAIDLEACTKTLDRLMGWAKFPNAVNPSKDILHSPAWCRAWLTLVQKNPDTFDPARLFRKAVTYPAYIYPLGSVKATCEILVKLYNKDARVPTNLKI